MTLVETFDNTISAAELTDKHATAQALARNYCTLADRAFERGNTDAFLKIGKELLVCLKELGATNAASAIKTQVEGGAAAHDTDVAASTFTKLRASFN